MKRPLFLLAASLFCAQIAHAAPAAILTRAAGAVSVVRGAKTLAAKSGLTLQNGDKIMVKSGAATIFSLAGPPKTITHGIFVVGAAVSNADSSLWKGVSEGLSRGLSRGDRRIAATMRPGEIAPVFPVNSRLDTPRPTFEWRPGALDAPRYEVVVSNAKTAIWRGQTDQTTLVYPASAPLLKGALSWQVAPLRLEDGVWKPIAGWMSRAAPFEIGSPPQIAAIRAQIGVLKGLNAPDLALSRAALWNAGGFRAQALRELENAGDDATITAFREELWRETGQNWRFEAQKPANLHGGADAAILAISPDAPLEISQRKTFASPDARFALQIPLRFGFYTLQMARGVGYTQLGTAALNGARIVVLTAPASDFGAGDDLLKFLSNFLDGFNALPANAGSSATFSAPTDTHFRGQNARGGAWKAVSKGVASSGETLEWREGDTVFLVVWGGQNGDATALRPLLDTLQIGPQIVAAPPSPELLALRAMPFSQLSDKMFEVAPASIAEMQKLNTSHQNQSFELPNDAVSVADFEKLDAARLQTAENSTERADAARVASALASRLGWDATTRGDAASAARFFARRVALEDESARAEDGALQAQARQNDADFALWSGLTPPMQVVTSYSVVLNGFRTLRAMFNARRHTLALQAGNAAQMENRARDALQMARGDIEVARLEVGDGLEVWDAKRAVADALDDLGDARQEMADLDGARAYFARALEWRTALPETYARRDLGESLRNRAALENAYGDPRLARDFYEKTLAAMQNAAPVREAAIAAQSDANLRILMQTNDAQTRAITLNNLGIISETLGDFTASETYYKQAIATAETIATTGFSALARDSMRATTLANLAVLRADAGDLDAADALFSQSIALHRASGDDESLALALLNSAGLDDERGQTDAALQKLAAARPIFAQLQSARYLVACDVFASKIARRRGELGRAETLASAALTLARSQNDWDWIASAARSMANIRLDGAKMPLSSAQKPQIAAFLDEAQRADARTQSASSQISTLGARARYQEKSGDAAGAVATLQSAIARLERVRATTNSGEQFSDIQSNFELYNNAVRLLLQLKRPEDAFDMLSRARSKKLRDALQISAQKSGDARLQSLLTRAAALDQKLAKTRAQLASETALPAPQRDNSKIANLGELLASTQAQFFEVSAQIKARNPRFERAVSLSPRELKKAQRAIPPGALLLQYAVLDDGLYIFAVTRDELHIYAPKIPKTDLNAAIRAYRGAVDADIAHLQRGEAVSSIDDPKSALRIASQTLSQAVLAPVQSEIDAAKIVAIIPSGELFYLPFHALGQADKGDQWRFLIEDKPVAYLAAGDVLSVATARDEESEGKGVLALGDPTGADLPAARLEVESIARLFPDSRALTGDGASKATLLLPSSLTKRILHLAAHGVLDSARPEQSFIQLSPSKNAAGQSDDGKLRVGEIVGLDLNRVDLVTLSACRTALGEGEPDGTEIASLAQGFSTAGTPSVVASLWSVEDQSTSRLMETFYGALADGASKGIALQKAQKTLLQNPKTRNPVFWAPFELLGDWR